MIKKAFDENGIKFAFPTVQVAGEGDSSAATAAVAQRRWNWLSPRQRSAAAPQNSSAEGPSRELGCCRTCLGRRALTRSQIAAFVALRSQACAFSALLPKVNRPPI